MIIIGLDYHPGMQQIALVDTETGEHLEQELSHSAGEAEKFYRDLKQKRVRVYNASQGSTIQAGTGSSPVDIRKPTQ